MMSCSYPPHFTMESKNKALREALEAAKLKLSLYRGEHSGEYVGGMQYTDLMTMIDEALDESSH